MKKFFLMVVTLCLGTIAFNACEKEDSSHRRGDVKEAVDLGLSVKWATCNVGASQPEEYGDYYAWGGMQPLRSMAKTSGLTAEEDVAHVKWGGTWRMPTREDLQELLTQCTWTWTAQNDVNGYKVTGPNGNSIFLPAAGSLDNGWGDPNGVYRAGEAGWYWSSSSSSSSSVNPNCAESLSFNSTYHDLGLTNDFERGHSIRPVCTK